MKNVKLFLLSFVILITTQLSFSAIDEEEKNFATSSMLLLAAPSVPPAPTYTKYCGYSTLTRQSPPSGVTYYWQTSATGTSIGNSLETYDVTSSGYYYLRAYDGTWSTAVAVNVTVNTVPSLPSAQDVELCGTGTVDLVAYSSEGHSIKWYNEYGAYVSTVESGANYTTEELDHTVYYFAEAYNSTTGCVGPKKTVYARVKQKPSAPSAPDRVRCGPGDVHFYAMGSSDVDIRWYNGTLTTEGEFNIVELNETRTLQVVSVLDGCESERRDVVGTIYEKPDMPEIEGDNWQCGATRTKLTVDIDSDFKANWYLNVGTLVSANESYYYPNVSSGESQNVMVRVYNKDLITCISEASVTVTGYTIPPKPSIGTADDYVCGNSLKTFYESTPYTPVWESGNTEQIGGTTFECFISKYNNEVTLRALNGPACYSEAAVKTIEWVKVPSAPFVPSKSRFGEGKFTFEASSVYDDVEFDWFEQSTLLSANENSFTTAPLRETKTYNVAARRGMCPSKPHEFTAKVTIPANEENTLKSPVEGVTINVGEEYSHDIATGHQVYYEVELLKYANLEITTENSEIGHSTNYTVLDRSGKRLYGKAGFPGKLAGFTSHLMPPGKYYVRVEANYDNSGIIRTDINVSERDGTSKSNYLNPPYMSYYSIKEIEVSNSSEQGFENYFTSDNEGNDADDIYYFFNRDERFILNIIETNHRTGYYVVDETNRTVGKVFYKEGESYYDLKENTNYYLVLESKIDQEPGDLGVKLYLSSPGAFYNKYTFEHFYAISSGDWHDPDTWSYSENGSPANTTPSSSDIVHIDGYTVDLNQNASCQDVVLSNEFGDTYLNVVNGDMNVYGEIKLVGKKDTNENDCKVNVKPNGYIRVVE